ncbi:mediator of RNA polymerase II transcription subunit 10b-like isoform X2 [Cicer arietinum]|uniref:Mediator of RNA polymerase II transcription subunit 10 n=1 Tax=Cicer arietinum TaxID=3827 RepID=A0A3Q7XC32_CICAR|nr:mediator of RNA polymerase II transcription subunit 10b-like isoform X1 [Cicer arietinum]
MDSSQNPAVGGNGTLISQTNDTTASAAGANDSMQNLNQVSNSIQKTLGLIHQLYLTVSTFNAAFQMPLLQRINGLVAELDNMVKLAEKCNIQVPMEVVNLIDDGKNPDEFTRDIINNCIAKNQITKGKTDALKNFRKHLLEELEQNFPDEVESFRESRAASAAPSVVVFTFKVESFCFGLIQSGELEELKRLAQAQSVLPNGDVRVKSEH